MYRHIALLYNMSKINFKEVGQFRLNSDSKGIRFLVRPLPLTGITFNSRHFQLDFKNLPHRNRYSFLTMILTLSGILSSKPLQETSQKDLT